MNQGISYIRQELTDLFPQQELNYLVNRIICHVCRMQTYQMLSCKDKKLSEKEFSQIQEITNRLSKHEPLQYILGEAEFYGLTFSVNPNVLIPRPETEELIDWIIQTTQKGTHNKHWRILDIGTGSGCIAITLAKHILHERVFGTDISQEALLVAEKNAKRNAVKIQWIQNDILSSNTENIPENIDIIASNPPYIISQEKKEMHANVLDYEPHLALFEPENQPLVFYEHISDIGKYKLKPGGFFFFEINALFGKNIYDMLQEKGYKNIEIKQDISGKDRMIKANL